MADEDLIPDSTIQFLRRHMELRQKKDEAEAAAKAAKKAHDESELELFEKLWNGPSKTLSRIDLGPPWGKVTFSSRETHFHKVIDDDELIEYFSNRAMLDDVSNPKFVGKRLNEIVRDVIEQGGSMPPGLSYRTNKGVTVTRQKTG